MTQRWIWEKGIWILIGTHLHERMTMDEALCRFVMTGEIKERNI